LRNRSVGEVLLNGWMIERGDERAGLGGTLHLVVGVHPNVAVRLIRRVARIQFLSDLVARLRPKQRVRLLVQGVLADVGCHKILQVAVTYQR
jgi:hypothetical protein